MERVDYQTVLEGVADLAGLDRDNLSNAEFGTLRGFIGRRLKQAWEYGLWPELMRCEQRWFRPWFDTTATYAAAAEVYDARGNNYFQALKNPAVASSATNAVGAVATLSFASTLGLVTGRQVYITVSGVSSDFNGTWLATVATATTLTYTLAGVPGGGPWATGTVLFAPSGYDGLEVAPFWAACATSYSADSWTAGVAFSVGTKRFFPQSGRFYQCHTAHTSSQAILPTNTTYWGVLTAFDAYVGYTQPTSVGATFAALGTVVGVWAQNPRVFVRGGSYTDALSVEFWLSENGVQVMNTSTKSVWVEWRLRAPGLKGVAYSASTVYTGGSGQAYFTDSTSGTAGNFYDCITTTVPAESPLTAPAKWAISEIPRRFEQYLVMGTVRDYLLSQEQAEKWAALKADVDSLLGDQVMVLRGQSGQEQRMVCGTR